jgi:hypothetical protein
MPPETLTEKPAAAPTPLDHRAIAARMVALASPTEAQIAEMEQDPAGIDEDDAIAASLLALVHAAMDIADAVRGLTAAVQATGRAQG